MSTFKVGRHYWVHWFRHEVVCARLVALNGRRCVMKHRREHLEFSLDDNQLIAKVRWRDVPRWWKLWTWMDLIS